HGDPFHRLHEMISTPLGNGYGIADLRRRDPHFLIVTIVAVEMQDARRSNPGKSSFSSQRVAEIPVVLLPSMLAEGEPFTTVAGQEGVSTGRAGGTGGIFSRLAG